MKNNGFTQAEAKLYSKINKDHECFSQWFEINKPLAQVLIESYKYEVIHC